MVDDYLGSRSLRGLLRGPGVEVRMPAIPLKLPPLPIGQAQAIAMLSDPDAEPAELAEAVSADPSLSAAVLRVANSAASAPVTAVTSVDVAVIRLGGAEVRRIISANVLGETFTGFEEAHVDPDRMWRYVITVALIAERMAPAALARVAFTAGILHDIGRLTMISTEPEAYARVVAMARKGLDVRYAETNVFGVDHTDWGAEVAAAWKFAPMLVDAVAKHHEGGSPLAELIRRAIETTEALGIGDSVQPDPEPDLEPGSPAAQAVERIGGREALTQRVDWFREALAAA